ncbi:hypothetical protein VB716_13170 [Synechococcus sp. CCY9201]|uniref:hypothetical protein n=1 Tax=Synechococcus sp. CCY9201 TaxID=174697 RepID=UPI002B1F8524|nr:hypothetical protein [Synechococcus sp. CCY9201]MEA5475173.1 hypothetical protein [Synechococcus sp. CCY9201]
MSITRNRPITRTTQAGAKRNTAPSRSAPSRSAACSSERRGTSSNPQETPSWEELLGRR